MSLTTKGRVPYLSCRSWKLTMGDNPVRIVGCIEFFRSITKDFGNHPQRGTNNNNQSNSLTKNRNPNRTKGTDTTGTHINPEEEARNLKKKNVPSSPPLNTKMFALYYVQSRPTHISTSSNLKMQPPTTQPKNMPIAAVVPFP